jgi:hypothetical protein
VYGAGTLCVGARFIATAGYDGMLVANAVLAEIAMAIGSAHYLSGGSTAQRSEL